MLKLLSKLSASAFLILFVFNAFADAAVCICEPDGSDLQVPRLEFVQIPGIIEGVSETLFASGYVNRTTNEVTLDNVVPDFFSVPDNRYDPLTEILHIPNISAGPFSLFVDLHLTGVDPITMAVGENGPYWNLCAQQVFTIDFNNPFLANEPLIFFCFNNFASLGNFSVGDWSVSGGRFDVNLNAGTSHLNGKLPRGTNTCMTGVNYNYNNQMGSDAVICPGASRSDLRVLHDRFKIEIEWNDSNGGGAAQGVKVTDDSGMFWFFDQNNWEVLVKVLDGCNQPEFNTFFVFAKAETHVPWELKVTDTVAGADKVYTSGMIAPSSSIMDTSAFLTCDE